MHSLQIIICKIATYGVMSVKNTQKETKVLRISYPLFYQLIPNYPKKMLAYDLEYQKGYNKVQTHLLLLDESIPTCHQRIFLDRGLAILIDMNDKSKGIGYSIGRGMPLGPP